MNKKIYIHIGPPKTGTTTLQFFFRALALQNEKYILFPKTGRLLDGASYYRIDFYRGAVLVRGPLNNHEFIFRILRNEIIGTNSNLFLNKLRIEIDTFPGSFILLSFEGFWFLNDLEIRKIIEVLKGYEINIVLYIRDQKKKMISMFTQHIKSGPSDSMKKSCVSFTHFIEEFSDRIFDEHSIIKKWNRHLNFSHSQIWNIVVRNFDDVISQASLEEDFILRVLGIDKSVKDISIDLSINAKNEKFSDYIYVILIYINKIEILLGKKNILRPLFYKTRDLIVKSKRVRNTIKLFRFLFSRPLLNQEDLDLLDSRISQRSLE